MEKNKLFDMNNLFQDEIEYIEDRLKQKYVYMEEYGNPKSRRKTNKPKINQTALKIEAQYKKLKRFAYYKKPAKIENKFLRLLIFSDFIQEEKIISKDKLNKLYETIMVLPSFILLRLNDLIINNLELKNRLRNKEMEFPSGIKNEMDAYNKNFWNNLNTVLDITIEGLNLSQYTTSLEKAFKEKTVSVLEYEETNKKIKTRLKKLELKYNDFYSDICEEIDERINESFDIPEGKIIIQVMAEHIKSGDNEYLMQLYKKNGKSLSETYHKNFKNIYYSYNGRKKDKGKKRFSSK